MERPEQQQQQEQPPELPTSDDSALQLRHPTAAECEQIWRDTWASWGGALDLPTYLDESRFLTTVPLARDQGMMTWVLVDGRRPPDQRAVLCSCESFAKRALANDAADGTAVDEEGVVHAIASVFTPPAFRGRGYAGRLLRELAARLRTWQPDRGTALGSVLYSDIGSAYYAKFGWRPDPNNLHLDFPPQMQTAQDPSGSGSGSGLAPPLAESDLSALCARDERMVRAAMAQGPGSSSQRQRQQRRRVTILPDLDHMLWHIRKEDFAARHLFGGSMPEIKGAIAGTSPGSQVWAIWKRRWYARPGAGPEAGGPDNVLYILRLVVERDGSANGGGGTGEEEEFKMDAGLQAEQVERLAAVLQAARAQAAEWQLDRVRLWAPSPWVRDAVAQLGMDYEVVERREDGVASALWYGDEGADGDAPTTWVNNEHYAWC